MQVKEEEEEEKNVVCSYEQPTEINILTIVYFSFDVTSVVGSLYA